MPALLLIYYIVPRKAKNPVLFAASLAFSALADIGFALILLFSCAFNYASGLAIDKVRHKKCAIAINIAVNTGLLLAFRLPGLIMPFYLAFTTLRALSYTIDVYRRTTATQHNFINFGLYLSFFALIPAGPVVRYNDAARQLTSRHSTGTRFLDGIAKFSAGLCKKAVIADSLYPLWSTVSGYDLTGLSAAHAWLGIICYALWVYFAFSGCSDMAIGLGKMFGFEFEENFKYPYRAKSVTEFCGRWHISLLKWFREYVHNPKKKLISLIGVWVLIGVWYGGSVGPILWGLYISLLLIIEKYLLKKPLQKIGIIANIYALFAVIIGFVPFALGDLSDIASYFTAMFGGYGGFGEKDFMYNLTSYAGTMIIAIIIASGLPRRIYHRFIAPKHEYIRYIFAIAGFMLGVAFI